MLIKNKLFFNKTQSIQGFTLVELLVVIAIIGILSTVAIVNLNSTRDRARAATVQHDLAGLFPLIVLCYDAELNLEADATSDCEGAEPPVVGHNICSMTGIQGWPELPDGWSYIDNCLGYYSSKQFRYSAQDSSGNRVDCTESGCVVS